MKKQYQSPVVTANDELVEGVYMASGSDNCYTTTAYIHQTPETGRGDYRIQVNGQHQANHHCVKQTLTIQFNIPVEYVSCNANGATLISGNNSTTLVIGLGYHQNDNDNIGFGDLIVKADPGLAISSVEITDVRGDEHKPA